MQTIFYFGSTKGGETIDKATKNRAKKNQINLDLVCGDKWTRTTDSRIFSPMLYQLSYITILLKCCKGRKMRILYKSFSEKIDPKFIKTS
jgi:hypothetical protein